MSTTEFPGPRSGHILKDKRRVWLIVLLAIPGILIQLCSCGFLAKLGQQTLIEKTQEDKIANVVESFFIAMKENDADEAYSLFSAFAQKRTVDISDLAAIRNDTHAALFDDFSHLESYGLGVINFLNPLTKPEDAPLGAKVLFYGMVTYENGCNANLRETLEKEKGEWKLVCINIR